MTREDVSPVVARVDPVSVMVEGDWIEYTLHLFPSDYIVIGEARVQITPEDYPHGAITEIKVRPIAAPVEREAESSAREKGA